MRPDFESLPLHIRSWFRTRSGGIPNETYFEDTKTTYSSTNGKAQYQHEKREENMVEFGRSVDDGGLHAASCIREGDSHGGQVRHTTALRLTFLVCLSSIFICPMYLTPAESIPAQDRARDS